MNREYNRALVFLLALFPGAGQMYLGLTRRGLEGMVLFFASFFLLDWVGLEQFIPVVVIPLWFFMFFDTFASRDRLQQGLEVPDQGVLNLASQLDRNRYHWVGIALIVLGGLAIIHNLTGDIAQWARFGPYVREYLAPVLLVILGIWLLVRAGRKKDNPEE